MNFIRLSSVSTILVHLGDASFHPPIPNKTANPPSSSLRLTNSRMRSTAGTIPLRATTDTPSPQTRRTDLSPLRRTRSDPQTGRSTRGGATPPRSPEKRTPRACTAPSADASGRTPPRSDGRWTTSPSNRPPFSAPTRTREATGETTTCTNPYPKSRRNETVRASDGPSRSRDKRTDRCRFPQTPKQVRGQPVVCKINRKTRPIGKQKRRLYCENLREQIGVVLRVVKF